MALAFCTLHLSCRLPTPPNVGWLTNSVGCPEESDWALTTSTLRRDVFYYANIQLGESVSTHLLAVEWGASGTVKTHLRMVRDTDGRALADLITRKRIANAAIGG